MSKVNGKRKRDGGSAEKEAVVLLNKLHHSAKEVRKAAKKAKTFEIQKLVKRLKGIRSKDGSADEVRDLESQLEVLKKFDHEPIGNTALRSKLQKDHLLSQNEHIVADIAELSSNVVTPAPPGSSQAKVQARLLSSKVLATEVASALTTLKAILQPDLIPSSKDGGEQEDVSRPTKITKKAKEAAILEKVTVSSGEPDSGDTPDSSDESRRVLDISDDEDNVDRAGWESGSIHSGGDTSDEDDEGSDTHSEDATAVASTTKITKAKSTTSKPSETGAESTFLPSLSVGFTRGDSDASDISEDEIDVAPKKNRRGQRARRAIWEKKFGRNANHVKNQREDPPKAKKFSGRPPSGRDTRVQQQQRPNASRPLPHPPQTQVTPKEEKSLHPSWEAKKRMKEKFNPTIVAPQGTKIVFDS